KKSPAAAYAAPVQAIAGAAPAAAQPTIDAANPRVVQMVQQYRPQYQRLLKLAQAITAAKRRPFFVLGGHGPSPDPAYFMKISGADAVVLGEGEVTIVELAAALAAGTKKFAGIKGLAWRDGKKTVVNAPRPLVADIDTLPLPAYEMFPMEYYRLIRFPHVPGNAFALPVLSARGCVFQCNFCYRMDKGYRPRGAAAIIEEVRLLQREYGITYVNFSDELFMASVARTEELCTAFLKAKLKFHWWCSGRLNFAKPDVLKLMKKAGCVFINYGIEAMDDAVLKTMRKNLTVQQIRTGIDATLAAGISPGFNIIYGHIGDTRATLEKAVQYLLEKCDSSQYRTIRPVTPYPGSPLYYEAIKRGLLRDCADFYENKHTNSDLLAINFTDMSDAEVHQALYEANCRLTDHYYALKAQEAKQQFAALYSGKAKNFRGVRQT
ncbi:MAG TPA: radical SAM protein, partial [bacterium]|nr:radical SAM protein [bacterium]